MFEYFEALKWLETDGQRVCPCSTISTVKNALYLLNDVKSKLHFAVCLINGLGANLTACRREIFSKTVNKVCVIHAGVTEY